MSFLDMAMSILGVASSVAGDGTPSTPVLDAGAVSDGASSASDVVSNIATQSGNTGLTDILSNTGSNPLDNVIQTAGTDPAKAALESGYTYTASAPTATGGQDSSVIREDVPTTTATGSPPNPTQMVNDQTTPGAYQPPNAAATNAPSGTPSAPQPVLSSQLTGEGAFGSANAGTAGSGVPAIKTNDSPSTLDAISKFIKENQGGVELGGNLIKGAMTQLGPQAAKLNAEANYLNQKATEYDKTQAYNELMRQRYIDSVNGMGTQSTAINPNNAILNRPGLINGARSA